MPSTPLLQLSNLPEGSGGGGGYEEGDSPATAFPRMRITDATPTPRGSPAPFGAAAPGKDVSQAGDAPSLAPPTSSQFCPRPSWMRPGAVDAQQGCRDGRWRECHCDAAVVGVQDAAPSPLFGGIFGGALNYDLEDKDAEQLRI